MRVVCWGGGKHKRGESETGKGKAANMDVSTWGSWPPGISRNCMDYASVVLPNERRSWGTYLPLYQPLAKVTLRGVNPPRCLPYPSQRGRESPQDERNRSLQQEAVPRGMRNVGYQGRQRELREKKCEWTKTRESKSCPYLETSQAKGTVRTDALRWGHAEHVSRCRHCVWSSKGREGRGHREPL